MTIQAITGAVLALLGTLAIPAACAALIRGAAHRPRPRPVTVRVQDRRR